MLLHSLLSWSLQLIYFSVCSSEHAKFAYESKYMMVRVRDCICFIVTLLYSDTDFSYLNIPTWLKIFILHLLGSFTAFLILQTSPLWCYLEEAQYLENPIDVSYLLCVYRPKFSFCAFVKVSHILYLLHITLMAAGSLVDLLWQRSNRLTPGLFAIY